MDYAKNFGIEVGGYDLICLDRNVDDYLEAVDANGHSIGDACFASGWYDYLRDIVINFVNVTGLSMLETDGPYGGESCYSHNHSHHRDVGDSVYQQTRLQSEFYKKMRELGVYVNQPDDYFFQGTLEVTVGGCSCDGAVPMLFRFFMGVSQVAPERVWAMMSSSTACRASGTCPSLAWACTTTSTCICRHRGGCSCHSAITYVDTRVIVELEVAAS